MIAIAIKGLTKKFNNHTVLNNVNLTVRLGEVLAIIGPSGSGKTTLLRSINLLETPDYGSIQVGNIIIDTSIPLYHQKKQICYLRQQVGFVFQHFHLFPHRSVLDNIIEGLIVVKKEPREEAVAKARKLLDQVGLRDKENFFPKNLSGGQQQRVAIARALAMRPEVILFDEPTSALDPELVGDVLSTIRNLANEQRTMVIVTHEISFARDVADQAIFMADGHIVEQSSADDLFTHPVHERTKLFLNTFLKTKNK
ncbi:L-cystine ABC transporter ATP-binding protein TcyN [Candidatus Palibaumannia cicadellinicola]|uniref:ABC transporter, ATP-binding protein n=1 Tax=Baumannia cicadellinicola subsp. Homalodisca coagulata TaxID=374463 RepID=Q1LTL4_BAUCH|nr:L-cystine ABC transporter ATP-binding protein TcyN [Candidatus Baumannia cicadellinicola]ABF14251.1 ABC transporter, ATP-binding protein [Baumannia cicadellinicola str. Hc (Homalodisca coagulata)]MCJ7462317.1 L-cystine ABC transporter ATP-binding protein YecC [Candidatus Baumannia cicadellinicola]MCJ7462837.1 L-cystine ABC transporter ATP-binding protein YecC [Candidatus Baumannia cicadellinicola]